MTDTAMEFALAEQAVRRLTEVLATLGDADVQRHTPCAPWRVRDVLAHLTGTTSALVEFTRTGRRELPDELPVLVDPIASTEDSIASIRAALSDESTKPAYRQRAAGDVAVEFTTHAWDLDPRLGIPEELAAAVLAYIEPHIDDAGRGQFFGPGVPCRADAPAGDRLVSFLGRDPAWRP